MVNGKPRWANQTDSGQNRLGPSDTRATERAETYPGIADAMASQWTAIAANYTFEQMDVRGLARWI